MANEEVITEIENLENQPNTIRATYKISPEAREILNDTLREWRYLIADCQPFAIEKRAILLNANERHILLGQLLNLIEPLLMDPAQMQKGNPYVQAKCKHEHTQRVNMKDPKSKTLECLTCGLIW
jgi:hypothetical protein